MNTPAFPSVALGDPGNPASVPGMSLRDYFAARAMSAIIAKIPFQEFPADWSPYERTAIGAYDYADAMLVFREGDAASMREALEMFMSHGCPVCSGDCTSANPPVTSCPMMAGASALAKLPQRSVDA